MANITKSPSVSNYKNVSSSKVKTIGSKQTVHNVYGKGEIHNNPDHRSGNERFILDAFYSNAHNLKASFIRLTGNEEHDTLQQYYRAHEEEVISGAMSLVEALESILKSSAHCDKSYGTHFRFLVESILHDFSDELEAIGISQVNYKFKLNRKHFHATLCTTPAHFQFLFKMPDGMIERLTSIYYKIQGITDYTKSEGQIIDFRT